MNSPKEKQESIDVVVSANYYYPHVSGLSETARMVAERLANSGLKVLVVCCRHRKDLLQHEVINGVHVERVQVLKMIRNGPLSIFFPFVVAKRARNAKLLNMHLPMLESGFISFLTPRTKKATTYQCDYVGPISKLGKLIERILDASNKYAVTHSSATIVSSHDYAQQSRLASALTNAVAIAPPFAVRLRGNPSFRDSEGFHYGFVGRIVVEKGITFLIEAFQQCGEPEDRLLIAGEGSQKIGESTFEQVLSLSQLDPRIKLLGFVPEGRMSDLYASMDAFVFPSVNRLEAFGMVQLEAITAGVPVIASNLPGVRTIVLQTGFGLIAEPGDVEDLSRAMNKIRGFVPPTSFSVTPEESLTSYLELFQSLLA